MTVIYVDEERCTGRSLCIEACPTAAIRLVNGVAQVEQSLCRECEVCLSACPNGAILTIQPPVPMRAPAPISASIPTSMRPVAPVRRPIGVRSWLGAAVGFIEREIVPRTAALLRNYGQQSRPVTAPRHPASMPSRGNNGGQGGRRARHRRRGRW